ncbi:MAG: RNA-binding protein [Candidatus Rokubacteria bacterium]|nr:RNA-binding protein [Candidatus Rokubacteria bacterium]
MSVKLFVGGLSFTTSNDSLRQGFARYGSVLSATVMMDRETGRSRGFGFVEMATTEEAEQAISGMNGAALDGRTIRVDKATPRGAGGPPSGAFRRPGGDRPGFGSRPPGAGPGGPRPAFGGPPRTGGGFGFDRGAPSPPAGEAPPRRRSTPGPGRGGWADRPGAQQRKEGQGRPKKGPGAARRQNDRGRRSLEDEGGGYGRR